MEEQQPRTSQFKEKHGVGTLTDCKEMLVKAEETDQGEFPESHMAVGELHT